MLICLILVTSHGVCMQQNVLLLILIIHNWQVLPAWTCENFDKMLFSISFKSNEQNIKMSIFLKKEPKFTETLHLV